MAKPMTPTPMIPTFPDSILAKPLLLRRDGEGKRDQCADALRVREYIAVAARIRMPGSQYCQAVPRPKKPVVAVISCTSTTPASAPRKEPRPPKMLAPPRTTAEMLCNV